MRDLRRLGLASAFVAAALVGVTPSADGTAASAARAVRSPYIVVLKDGADATAAAQHAKRYGAAVSLVYKHALRGYAAGLTKSGLAAIESDPSVLFVERDRQLQAAATPPPTFPQVTQRSVTRIDGDRSSTRSGDGKGSVPVNVAVIDSGIDTDHPDLNVVGGTNCVGDKNGFDDPVGHGTLVAGSIGALDNGIDFVGVAPGARLWAVRVLQQNNKANGVTGHLWDRLGDLDQDGRGSHQRHPGREHEHRGRDEQRPRCRRPKLWAFEQGRAPSRDLQVGRGRRDVRRRRRKRLCRLPRLSAGRLRRGPDRDRDERHRRHPGRSRRCGHPLRDGFGDDVAAPFSNFATTAADQAHTVAAPGVCVPSTYFDGALGHGSGTSFASPLVAGTVALCIYSGPCGGLTPAQIVRKIVADAAAYNTAKQNSGYGFQGDPLRPISGTYYGYLIRADLY